jgi:hypothetical protein
MTNVTLYSTAAPVYKVCASDPRQVYRFHTYPYTNYENNVHAPKSTASDGLLILQIHFVVFVPTSGTRIVLVQFLTWNR